MSAGAVELDTVRRPVRIAPRIELIVLSSACVLIREGSVGVSFRGGMYGGTRRTNVC